MANDFTQDANCVALWKLDNGALTTDTIGGNTLTNAGVASETGDFKEGDGCGDFELSETDILSITDGNLDADFPLQSANANKKFYFCHWMKRETNGVTHNIYGKYHAGDGTRSMLLQVTSSNSLKTYYGYNGGAGTESKDWAYTISAGIWYHIGLTYDIDTRTMTVRIYNDNTSSATTKTNVFSNDISPDSADWVIGNVEDLGAYFDGLIDEFVVFKDVLAPSSIDSIRSGTYYAVFSITGTASATASMTGTAVNTFDVAAVGSMSAIASMTGTARNTADVLAVGSMSAIATMTGTAHIPNPLVKERPDDYDEDKFWDEETGTWLASRPLSKSAGGRNKEYLVVISDQDKIYVGGL